VLRKNADKESVPLGKDIPTELSIFSVLKLRTGVSKKRMNYLASHKRCIVEKVASEGNVLINELFFKSELMFLV
jgi:hypothetical protein